MNDEIREILENIKKQNEWNGIEYFKTPLSTKDANKLLDYIKNLQQENKRLKEWKKDLLNENIELENIRKEAIEYINKNKDLAGWVHCLDEDLLNILQNGSDEEWRQLI